MRAPLCCGRATMDDLNHAEDIKIFNLFYLDTNLYMVVEEFLGLELLLAVGALKVPDPLVEILQ